MSLTRQTAVILFPSTDVFCSNSFPQHQTVEKQPHTNLDLIITTQTESHNRNSSLFIQLIVYSKQQNLCFKICMFADKLLIRALPICRQVVPTISELSALYLLFCEFIVYLKKSATVQLRRMESVCAKKHCIISARHLDLVLSQPQTFKRLFKCANVFILETEHVFAL